MLQELVKIAHYAPTLPIHNYYAALVLPLQARLLVAPPSSLNTWLRTVLLCTNICVAFLGESKINQDDFIAGYNYNLFMGVCCMHSVHLTFTTRSRIDAHKVDSSSKRYHSDLGWSGAFEMLTNFRGIGMNWGVPSEKLPAVYKHFVTDTLFEMLKHHVIHVTSTAAILRLSQYNPDEVMGRDVAITVAFYALAWSGLNLTYSIVSLCVYTLTKLLGLPFDKSRWPPLFDNVITSDNVRTFWNNKWQCLFRRHFIMCGYKPAFNLINALSVPGDIPHYCGLMGAFTVSGLIHELCLRSTSRTIFMDGTFPTFGFFIIQALAIILENEFYKYTGRRVSGIFGRLWFAFIVIFTAIPMARHSFLA